MEFAIEPYVGAGKIRLGMTSQQIQDVLNATPEKFKKSAKAEIETDAYKWCHIYYKNPGVCEAIEFFQPAQVILGGQNLLGKPFETIKQLFLKHDDSVVLENAGLTSLKYGVGIYAPSALKEPSEPIERVIVFEKGYYD